MKLFLGVLVLGLSVQAQAADDVLVSRSLDQVRASRQELQEVQRQLPPHLRDVVLQTLQRLDYVDQSLTDSLRRPGRPVPPPPPHSRPDRYAELEGTCEIDDDLDFSPGQIVFGKVEGRDVAEVAAQCQAIARLTYGANGSSGVKDVREE